MTTYNTGNPIGSTAPQDLYDNAQALDEAVNSADHTFTDRLGQTRKTYKGIEAEASLYAADAATSASNAAASATGAATSASAAAASAEAAEEAAETALLNLESNAAHIQMDGAQSAGALSTVARGDHRHPTDTSRAPLDSPGLTGTPTAPTAAAGTNTTQIATTAFAMTAASNAVAGVATTFASSAENASGTVENKAVDPLGIREAFNATGSAPVFACRAWVNFNGTGTVSILASGNVSSITDNGTGNYTVNFATAMPDVKYAVTGSAMRDLSNYAAIFTAPINTDAGGARTTTSATVGAVLLGSTVSNVDAAYMSVAIFR